LPRGFLFWDRVAGEDDGVTASLPYQAALFGRDGELISLSIATEPRLLEELLEALASLDFPVNPQLYHRAAEVLVEFPAYSNQIERVGDVLLRRRLPGSVHVSRPRFASQSAAARQ
jgi:hypothetical protein